MKKCVGCGEIKPLDCFYSERARCKTCCHIKRAAEYVGARRERQLAQQRAHYARNRDQYAEKWAKKRRENPESIRAKQREYVQAARDRVMAYLRLWRKANPDKQLKYQRKWDRQNKEKRRAHVAVKLALRRGLLKKEPCAVCGTTVRLHAHHDDYSRPLDVRWLCPKHHAEHHRNDASKAKALELLA